MPPHARAPRSATIAIIEDDFAVRNALAFALQTDGLSVRAYECAEDALADALLAEIECFVVDYKLPRMNGLDLLGELRRRGIDTPAILIATAPGAAIRMDARRLDVPIVEKPLLDHELYDQIALQLGRRASVPSRRS
jgi:FixJ family two-component response regulator